MYYVVNKVKCKYTRLKQNVNFVYSTLSSHQKLFRNNKIWRFFMFVIEYSDMNSDDEFISI